MPRNKPKRGIEAQTPDWVGKLRLKVPRVRSGKAFRPAILPPRWKRADKDYEELLIAMLDGGYSQALGAHP